jgi:hypothetical protein
MNKQLYFAALSLVFVACDSSHKAPMGLSADADVTEAAQRNNIEAHALHGDVPVEQPESVSTINSEAPTSSVNSEVNTSAISTAAAVNSSPVPAEIINDQQGGQSAPVEPIKVAVEQEVEDANAQMIGIIRVAAYKANSQLAGNDPKLVNSASAAQALQLKRGETGALTANSVANFEGGIDAIVLETSVNLPLDLTEKDIKVTARKSDTGEFVKIVTVARVERRSSKLDLFRFDEQINDAIIEIRFAHDSLDHAVHYYFANVAGEMNRDTRLVRVTVADLSRVQSSLSQPYRAEADFNRDGMVDGNDLAIVQGRISPAVRLRFPTFTAGK